MIDGGLRMIDIVSLCSKNNPYLGSHLAQPLALSK
jgi:hypothetical protein